MSDDTQLDSTNETDQQNFVGSRYTTTGQLGKQATTHMPREEFRQTLCEMYSLVKQENIDDNKPFYLLPIEQFLESLMLGVKNTIELENKHLFQKMVSFTKNGVVLQYSQSFRRIMDGKYPYASPLESDLSKLLAENKGEFLSIQQFLLRDQTPFPYRNGKNLISNIQPIYESFQTLMNVLVMYMSLQYKAIDNMPYYDNGNAITFSINEIRGHLDWLGSHLNGQDFVISSFIHQPDALQAYLIASKKTLDVDSIRNLITNNLEHIKTYDDVCGKVVVQNLKTTTDDINHFATIYKMLAFLNVVEEAHQKLKLSATTGEDQTVELLQLPRF